MCGKFNYFIIERGFNSFRPNNNNWLLVSRPPNRKLHSYATRTETNKHHPLSRRYSGIVM